MSQIAERVGVPVSQVKNVIIWGNHSATQYPDVRHAVIANYPREGASEPGERQRSTRVLATPLIRVVR